MKDQTTKRFSRRSIVLFWLALVSAILGTLIYLEQIRVLYVLATVALVAILLVVAFADLENMTYDGGFKDV
ncbi:MAG TPA: hypothetical protein PKD26_02180 [Pyrinomonadaceae bacterium]|nr:hypothetical protein [Pyrinomonadaceae bacterium]